MDFGSRLESLACYEGIWNLYCRRSSDAVEEFLQQVAARALLGCLKAYMLHLISLLSHL
jgi:hypothetical protein